MREVTGFITRDGTFYETKAEAEYEEAKVVLEGLLVAERIQHEPFIETLEKLHDQVATFVAKYDAFLGVKRQRQEADWDRDNDDLNEFADGSDSDGARSSSGTWKESVAPESAEDDFDTSDLPGGEADSASVLDESLDRSEHVSDMGSGEQPAKVQHNGPKHGSRSGKPDAQRIRRGQDVATKAQSRTGKARRGHGSQDTRR